jgi:hypothetical protein
MADRMFYMNECVRSSRHGMGIVVNGGWNPAVQFLDGPMLRVEGETLRIIPDQVYDSEIINRADIERWLDWRMRGVVRPPVRFVRRPRASTLAVLREALNALPVPLADDDTSGVLWFTAEELNNQADSHGDGIVPIDQHSVRIIVRRIECQV